MANDWYKTATRNSLWAGSDTFGESLTVVPNYRSAQAVEDRRTEGGGGRPGGRGGRKEGRTATWGRPAGWGRGSRWAVGEGPDGRGSSGAREANANRVSAQRERCGEVRDVSVFTSKVAAVEQENIKGRTREDQAALKR